MTASKLPYRVQSRVDRPALTVFRQPRPIRLVLASEWIKFSTVRSNKLILALTAGLGLLGSWASAYFVTDQELTVADVFIYPTVLTAVLAAVAGVLLFTAETQHGTLAVALMAQPNRRLIVLSKSLAAAAFGVALGVVGLAAGLAGAAAGGLEMGDASGMVATSSWALIYTSVASLLGLGVGMVVRHAAGAITGLLVWWMVIENLILQFAPAKIARLLPFDAGYRLLEMESELDTPEIIAASLDRPLYSLIFGGYAALALALGWTVLHRRDEG